MVWAAQMAESLALGSPWATRTFGLGGAPPKRTRPLRVPQPSALTSADAAGASAPVVAAGAVGVGVPVAAADPPVATFVPGSGTTTASSGPSPRPPQPARSHIRDAARPRAAAE